MTSQQVFFLALLSDHISGASLAVPDPGMDWDGLFDIAQAQSLAGLCYVQLRGIEGVPPEIMQCFHTHFMNDVFYAANRQLMMERLTNALDERSVAFLPFKGWILKDAWPVPQLRTMGDIDILIRPDDREKADEIMRLLSYDRYIDNHAVWTYSEKQIMFELHDHMFYDRLSNNVDYRSYFDKAWEYASDGLDPGFHFIYMIAHMAKHIINSGLGFRSFLDLVFFCRAWEGKLHWDWIIRQLEDLRLLDFAKTCFALCREWFHVETPLSDARLGGDFIAQTTDKVFKDGLFGLENEQNEAAASARDISRTEAPYLAGALRLTIRRIFPRYRDMQLVPWYGFLDGRPWLLPAAWVFRWFYCLKNKMTHSLDLMGEPFSRRDVIDERNERLHQWGL